MIPAYLRLCLGQRPAFKVSIVDDSTLESFSAYQKKLFASAYGHLKGGGQLVYSTCTMNLGENEEVVSWALKTFKDLSLVGLPFSLDPPMNALYHPGMPIGGLLEGDADKCARFVPGLLKTPVKETGHSLLADTIAFFISKFAKTAPAQPL